MHPVEESWRAALRPPDRRPIYEWAKDEIRLPHSARASEFEIETSPWLKAPFDAVVSNLVRVLTIMASTQSSKTTFLELLVSWLVRNDPGPCMMNMQTDDDAKEMKETRLDGIFKSSQSLAGMLPARNKNRKDAIIFPHMPLFIHGANKNNLQGKSIRWLLNDEPWLYKPGLLGEAYERVTSFWNSRIVNTSQGGIEGDDLDKAFQSGSQHEWGFTCPECGLWQPFSLKRLAFDDARDTRGGYLFDEIRPTVRYCCAGADEGECNATFADDVSNRRLLSRLGSYEAQNPSASADNVSFHWNRLTVYWNPWHKLLEQKLNAELSRGRGDLEPYRKLVQKVEGLCFKESATDFELPVARGAFKCGEEWPLEGSIKGLLLRIMTVDVQQDCFYVVIRSWSNAAGTRGHSRLRAVKLRAVSWEDVRDFQMSNGVPDGFVFCDAGHKPADVYHHCAKYSWRALLGDSAKSFPHSRRNPKTKKGEIIFRYFSKRGTVLPGNGMCLVYRWSNLSVKDTLAALRLHQAEGVTWEAAADAPEEYFEQMDSEARREVSPGVWRWIKTRANHLWDCEAMQITVAYMLKLVGAESLEGGLTEDGESDAGDSSTT